LRETFDFDIIGMEPALKVGAEYKEHSRIAVWATPLTLQEQKFQNLMHRFEGDHEIVTVACEKLVECVENDRLQDKAYVKSILQEYLEQSHPETIDCIVLGCTHFIFFKEELEKMTEGKIAIVDGNLGTVKRLESLLKQKDLCAQNGQGSLQLDNSLPEKNALAQKLVQELKEQYGKHEKCMADLQ
jgi:glutamate racemase